VLFEAKTRKRKKEKLGKLLTTLKKKSGKGSKEKSIT
jgi:hypothetical protein